MKEANDSMCQEKAKTKRKKEQENKKSCCERAVDERMIEFGKRRKRKKDIGKI